MENGNNDSANFDTGEGGDHTPPVGRIYIKLINTAYLAKYTFLCAPPGLLLTGLWFSPIEMSVQLLELSCRLGEEY